MNIPAEAIRPPWSRASRFLEDMDIGERRVPPGRRFSDGNTADKTGMICGSRTATTTFGEKAYAAAHPAPL